MTLYRYLADNYVKETTHEGRKISIPCLEKLNHGSRPDWGFLRQVYHEGGGRKVRMNGKSLRYAIFVESCMLASEYGEIMNYE